MSYLYRHSFENAEQNGEIEIYREVRGKISAVKTR